MYKVDMERVRAKQLNRLLEVGVSVKNAYYGIYSDYPCESSLVRVLDFYSDVLDADNMMKIVRVVKKLKKE